MNNICVLVANAATARLFVADNLRVGELKLLREFEHPDSRKKSTDLVSDRPGHYKSECGSRGSFSKNDPKEVEAEHFAIELAKHLKLEHEKNKYKEMIVIAPSHFFGVLKKHLHAVELKHIAKDYTKYEQPKLLASLREVLFG